MLAKLKKAYVNFTLTFAIPLLILNAITGHYSAWYDRKTENFETLVACRKLADKGLGTREECQEEFNNSYENFLAQDILDKELFDPLYNPVSYTHLRAHETN